MGEIIQVRITYLGNEGTLYSEIQDYRENDIEIGEWLAPFTNEEGNSTAFDLAKELQIFDSYPMRLQNEGIMAVKIEKI